MPRIAFVRWYWREQSVVIAEGAHLSSVFDFENFRKLGVHVSSAWTSASIGFYVSSDPVGTFQPAYDDDGNLLQIDSAVAGRSYNAPYQIENFAFCKLWSQNGSGVDVAQTSARTILLDTKG